MTRLNLPAEGGCRCGAVRIRVSESPLITMACHCTGCQKMSSSAYSLSAAIPVAGFEIIAGQTVIGGMHGEQEHHFCAWCMTWMFTRFAAMPFVNLRPTMLDDAAWYAPFVETFTSEKLAWAVTPARHSFAAFPPLEEMQRLLADFAEWTSPVP